MKQYYINVISSRITSSYSHPQQAVYYLTEHSFCQSYPVSRLAIDLRSKVARPSPLFLSYHKSKGSIASQSPP